MMPDQFFNAEESYESSDAEARPNGNDYTQTPFLNFVMGEESGTGQRINPYQITFRKKLYQVERLVLMPLQLGKGRHVPKAFPRVQILPKKALGKPDDRAQHELLYLEITVGGCKYRAVRREPASGATSSEVLAMPPEIKIGNIVYLRSDLEERPGKKARVKRMGVANVPFVLDESLKDPQVRMWLRATYEVPEEDALRDVPEEQLHEEGLYKRIDRALREIGDRE
jgi:hypothetical protein